MKIHSLALLVALGASPCFASLRGSAPRKLQSTPFNGTIINTIASTDTYDQPWPSFDSAQTLAYETISNYLLAGEMDIRSVYPQHLANAQNWWDSLQLIVDNNYQPILTDVEPTCDSACVESVVDQLMKELGYIDEGNTWHASFEDFNTKLGSNAKDALDSAYTLFSIASTDYIPAPPVPQHKTSFLSVFLDITSDVLAVAAPFTGGISEGFETVLDVLGATAGLVADVADDTTPDNDPTTDVYHVDFSENNQLSLEYSKLILQIPQYYANLTLVNGAQYEMIAGNYGKLEAFHNQVYRVATPPAQADNDALIADIVGQEVLLWKAYAMLFPMKYQLYGQKEHYGNGFRCTGCGFAVVPDSSGNPYGSTSGTEYYRGYTKYYHGWCDQWIQDDITCNVDQWLWIASTSNQYAGPSQSIVDALNSNKYALSAYGFGGNWIKSMTDWCHYDYGYDTCTFNGMTLPLQHEPDWILKQSCDRNNNYQTVCT